MSQETSGPDVTPAEKLDKVIQLAELCIELIQQNEEHHAEVRKCNEEVSTFFGLKFLYLPVHSDYLILNCLLFLF